MTTTRRGVRRPGAGEHLPEIAAEAYRHHDGRHTSGKGIAGIYPWEVAETKVEVVASMARTAGFPLRAVTEEA
jgi:hypothetical protein